MQLDSDENVYSFSDAQDDGQNETLSFKIADEALSSQVRQYHRRSLLAHA